jgi:hypothetical protein
VVMFYTRLKVLPKIVKIANSGIRKTLRSPDAGLSAYISLRNSQANFPPFGATCHPSMPNSQRSSTEPSTSQCSHEPLPVYNLQNRILAPPRHKTHQVHETRPNLLPKSGKSKPSCTLNLKIPAWANIYSHNLRMLSTI